MARIPESDLERLKREVSVERLAEARGVRLERRGADLIGRCPFHDDRTPSLVITPAKNLWHCLGECRAGGGPIDWVMKAEGASFRHAVELLRAEYLPGRRPLGGEAPPRRGTVRKLAPPVEFGASGRSALDQVAVYYHQTLRRAPEARAYLATRGLDAEELIERFQLGFGNRTLGLRLPASNRLAGAEMRGRLQALGILRESGHEHFNGSLVVPIRAPEGTVLGMYGRKITPRLTPGTPNHLYLPGPRRGVWNEEALVESKEIILCEALFDAMTFWCAGFRNVTASYGVNGFTADHRAAFAKYGVKRVYLAYDPDPAGDGAATALAGELMAQGVECFRVRFPRELDANAYALKVQPAQQSLGVLLRGAAWLGKPAMPHSARFAEDTAPQPGENAAEEAAALPPMAAMPAPPPTESSIAAIPEPIPVFPLAASPEPEAAPLRFTEPLGAVAGELRLACGERRYRVRGLERNAGPELLKINLMVRRGERFHVDALDLYSARQRGVFVKQAAEETGCEEETLKRDLGRLLGELEQAQAERAAAAAQASVPGAPEMTPAQRAAALDLLKSPDLIERILGDFERCGVVGEETNKLVGYLGATSRRLRQPLGVVVQSSTAAGKSALMDAVLAFIPEEERVQYSAMTGQALYYMGSMNLKHKVLAIAEEEGASRASYALKLLQSEGSLAIASTGKDPETGKLVTHEYRVEGPVMIFLTTTAIDLDEELLNRCLVLGVNEEREQTRAIHRLQRERETARGLAALAAREEIVALHRNAQRLLEPVAVANEYAGALTFPDAHTRSRRDHVKYLTLIRTIALLHQHQRPRRRLQGLDYIEVAPSDIALANRLAGEVLGRTLDELPPQTRRLLALLDAMVRAGCEGEAVERSEYRFSRRQAREYCGWGRSQMQVHLHRLEEMEYLLPHRGARGQSFVYELVYELKPDGERCVLPGLIDPATLPATLQKHRYDGDLPGSDPNLPGANRPQTGPGRGAAGVAPTRRNATSFSSLAAQEEKTACPGPSANGVVVVDVDATGAGA